MDADNGRGGRGGGRGGRGGRGGGGAGGRGGGGGGGRGGRGGGQQGRGGQGGGRGGFVQGQAQGGAASASASGAAPAPVRSAWPPSSSAQQPQQQQQQRQQGEETAKLSKLPRAFTERVAAPPFEVDSAIVTLERVRPVRPALGSRGKKIKLFANCYPLSIPDADCYHYDVDIKPETLPAVNRRIFEQWKKAHASIEAKVAVYDGRKNLYTPKRLPIAEEGDSLDVVLKNDDSDREQKFKVKVKLAAVINMERLHRFIANKGDGDVPREAMTVLDLILAARPNTLFTPINKKTGSSFYQPYNPEFNISGGLNMRQGWKQSVKVTYKEVLLNLDVACTAFYRAGPLVDVVSFFFNRNRIQDVNPRSLAPGTIEFQRLSKFLSNVNVDITYRDTGRRKYKIRGLSKQTPDKAIITKDDKTKITVKDYFFKEFKRTIQYPFLPLVMCGNTGQILIPMEFLIVRDGQRHLGKLSDVQTANVIKITAVPPPDRQKRISDGRTKLHDATGGDSLLKAWGVNIDPGMKKVDGRVLQTPVVTGSAQVTPQNGAYDLAKVGNVKFFKPAKLEYWGIAVFGDTRNMQFAATQDFMQRLFTECVNRGMYVSKRDIGKVTVAQQRRSIEETLLDANTAVIEAARLALPPGTAMPTCAQLIFCIFERGNGIYDEIKLLAETKLNLMTQCFLAKHLPPHGPKPGVTTNLALKVNAKLGGVNMVVDPATQLNVLGKPIPTMIMGADVTHPPPGANGGVSIASVVASMDAKYAEYRAAIRVQGPRLEIIGDIKSMAMEHLQQFQIRARGRLPDRLLFFRDGVSEGQFGEVALQEVQNLKLALREAGAGNCKLTFLVVNKRHAYRFFAQDSKDADRKGNLMAGTVIDSGITHPFEFDFFLNSHQGLQGTSRSSHYHVLYDENGFTADDLQEITYRMCYLFARATRSVSIVPAVYYAHLVAYRARCYRPGGTGGFSELAGSSVTGIESAAIDEFESVTDEMKKTMYFT
ncbi:argonaute 1 [Physocladia obscura]|uniref:Argonaute 1 n=1 Tax=Physocladia obscura TaxID=109957 RepID=A0AAD5SZP8_9FUNG|nr:argonaute 1 [Physocladia obscura]